MYPPLSSNRPDAPRLALGASASAKDARGTAAGGVEIGASDSKANSIRALLDRADERKFTHEPVIHLPVRRRRGGG
jgi:hypothetical protein